jgi:hypothetical protein
MLLLLSPIIASLQQGAGKPSVLVIGCVCPGWHKSVDNGSRNDYPPLLVPPSIEVSRGDEHEFGEVIFWYFLS